MSNRVYGEQSHSEDSRDKSMRIASEYMELDTAVSKVQDFMTSQYSTIGENFYNTPINVMASVPGQEDQISPIKEVKEQIQTIGQLLDAETNKDLYNGISGDRDADGITDDQDTDDNKTPIKLVDEIKDSISNKNLKVAKNKLDSLLKIFDKLSEGSTGNAAAAAVSAAGNVFNPMQNKGAGDEVGKDPSKVESKEGTGDAK